MIHLDPRKGSGELKDLFAPFDVQVKSDRNLETADFLFIGNGPEDMPVTVGVERKCISARSNDLLDSMQSRRLAGKQLNDLCQLSFAYIVVEGSWRCGDKGEFVYLAGRDWKVAGSGGRSVLYRAVINYLNSIRLKACTVDGWPVIVERTNNPFETVAYVVSLFKWFTEKRWDEHTSHDQVYAPYDPAELTNSHRAGYRRRTIPLVEKMAAQIPGFDSTARQVGERFRTGEGMVLDREYLIEQMVYAGLTREKAERVIEVHHSRMGERWEELRVGKGLKRAGEKGRQAWRLLREG